MIIKKKWFNNDKLHNFNISFWSSTLVISVFSIVLLIAVTIGFDSFFELFHNIFFLGKENWLLDETTDEIISILPQEYFMNCSILILSIIVVITITIIIKEIKKRRKELFCNNSKSCV